VPILQSSALEQFSKKAEPIQPIRKDKEASLSLCLVKHFTPRGKSPLHSLNREGVDPRTCLDGVKKRKFHAPAGTQTPTPQSSRPCASVYIDRVISASQPTDLVFVVCLCRPGKYKLFGQSEIRPRPLPSESFLVHYLPIIRPPQASDRVGGALEAASVKREASSALSHKEKQVLDSSPGAGLVS
jgi:hypothetical protein